MNQSNTGRSAGDLTLPAWRCTDISPASPGAMTVTARFTAEFAGAGETVTAAPSGWSQAVRGELTLTIPAASADRFHRGELYDTALQPAQELAGTRS